MAVDNKEGEICEVCKDDKFVSKFCSALNGGEACRKMTDRAANGEITQEEYYKWAMDMYGRDKVAEALERASIESSMNDKLSGGQVQTPTVPAQVQAPAQVLAQVQATAQAQAQPQAPEGAKQDFKQPDAIETVGGKSEVEIMNATLDESKRQFKSSIKGICLPCIGETWASVLRICERWYKKDIATLIENEVVLMESGEKSVEDCLTQVLKTKDIDTTIDTVLTDMNRVMELARDTALKENPKLIRSKAPEEKK